MALRRWLLLLVPCVAYGTVVALFSSAGNDARALNLILPIAVVGLNFTGILTSVIAATRRVLPRRLRRAWWLMALSFLLYLGAGAAFGQAAASGLTSLDRLTPGLAVAIFFRLGTSVAILGALLGFATQGMTRRGMLKMSLDVTTVVGGGSIAMWYLIVGPAVDRGEMPAADLAMGAAVIVSDLVMVLGVCVALLRGVSAAVRRPVTILIVGILSSLCSDLYLAVSNASGSALVLTVPTCVVMATPIFVLGLAAADQSGAAGLIGADRPAREYRVRTVTPYVGLAIGFAMLVLAAVRSGLFWAGLIGGAAIMIVGVVGRQLVVLRENHELVVTDGLTGLANRIRLTESLDVAVARSRRTGLPVGVLVLDMDDFKQVNDRLGHEAGDALLVALAGVLRGEDQAARLGGDEFAVVLDGLTGPADALVVADRILAVAAATEVVYKGEPMTIRVSIGVAVASFRDGDVEDGAALLHQADQAMYDEKRAGTHGRRLHIVPRQSVGSVTGT